MAAALDDLQDFITCEVCLNSFDGRDPRSLSCLHAFCLDCISQIHRAALKKDPQMTSEICCPICRAITHLPNGLLDTLPQYFQANQVKDILMKYQQQTFPAIADESKCTLCDIPQNWVVSYCFTCKEALCDGCYRKHDVNQRFKAHVQVAANKSTIASLRCKVHGSLVEAYCVDCFTVVCKRCQLMSHEHHTIQDLCLNDEIENVTDEKFQTQLTELDQTSLELTEIEEDFDFHVTSMHEAVTEYKKKLQKQLEEQEKALHIQLDKHQSDNHKNIRRMKDQLLETKRAVKKVMEQSVQIRKPLVNISGISFINANPVLDQLHISCPSKNPTLFEPEELIFLPGPGNVVMGKLSTISKEKLSKGQKYDHTAGAISADVKLSAETTSTFFNPSHDKEGAEAGSCKLVSEVFIAWGDDISSLDCFKNGDVILVIPQRIVLTYNIKPGTTLSDTPTPISFPPGKCSWVHPLRVAVDKPTSTVVVTHEDGFTVCCPNTPQWSLTTHKCEDILSLTFSNAGCIILGTTSKVLYKCNVDGKKIWKKKKTHDIAYLAVDGNDRIIVSDGCDQVHVYTPSGDHVFSRCPFGPMKQLIPLGVCTDSNNNILMVDGSSGIGTIVMFNPKGTFVREVVRCNAEFITMDGGNRLIAGVGCNFFVFDYEP